MKINYFNLYNLFKIQIIKKIIIVLCNKLKNKVSDFKNKNINKQLKKNTKLLLVPYKIYIFSYKNHLKIFLWMFWYLKKKNYIKKLRQINNISFFNSFLQKKTKNKFIKNRYLANRSHFLLWKSNTFKSGEINNIHKKDSFLKKYNVFSKIIEKKKKFKKRFIRKAFKRNNYFLGFKLRKRKYKKKIAFSKKPWIRKKLIWTTGKLRNKIWERKYLVRNMHLVYLQLKYKKLSRKTPYQNLNLKPNKPKLKIEKKHKFFSNNFHYSKKLLILQYLYLLKNQYLFKAKKKLPNLVLNFKQNLLFLNIYSKYCFNKFKNNLSFSSLNFKIINFFKKKLELFFPTNNIKIFMKIGFSSVFTKVFRYQLANIFKYSQRKNLIQLNFIQQLLMLFLLKDLDWFLVFFLDEFKKRNKSFFALINLKQSLKNIPLFYFNILGFYLQIKGKLNRRSSRKVKYVLEKGVRPLQPNKFKTYIHFKNLNLKVGTFGFKLWLLTS